MKVKGIYNSSSGPKLREASFRIVYRYGSHYGTYRNRFLLIHPTKTSPVIALRCVLGVLKRIAFKGVNMFSQSVKTIILVENNPGHARLIEKKLRRGTSPKHIIKFCDGEELIRYLEEKGSQKMSNLLVMLDLDIPGKDGYEVLRFLKSHKNTRHIPVVVFSVTDEREKIAQCYDLGCNLYATKPLDYRKFCDAVGRLSDFCSLIKLPEINGN